MMSADVSYRAEHYDGKMNFVLLAGGTMIGLGVTLLVESLIALLFRIEKVATERRDIDRGEELTEEDPPDTGEISGESTEDPEPTRPEKPPPDH